MNLLEYIMDHFNMPFQEAQGIILAGKVLVNSGRCNSLRYVIKKNDKIEVKGIKKQFVTRSGHKLEKALSTFGIDVADKVCIDIGASQGGFTDCLLQHNAKKVYAVDVAYGILDWKIRADARVVILERTNARYLNEAKIGEACDIIVEDVSFISVVKILPHVRDLLKPDGRIITLFKPQFELEKAFVGKDGNIDDLSLIINRIDETVHLLKDARIHISRCTYSPIRGNSGNIEFLLYGDIAEQSAVPLLMKNEITECVEEAFAVL